jgi:hypothetical protein
MIDTADSSLDYGGRAEVGDEQEVPPGRSQDLPASHNESISTWQAWENPTSAFCASF